MKVNTYHSSKGNQIKWNEQGRWHKLDYLGYESLAEFVVSSLLAKSNVDEFVDYQLYRERNNELEVVGCLSEDFLQEGEELITVERLVQQYKGQSIAQLMVGKTVEDKIRLTVDMLEEITGIQDFGKYITLLLEVDCFFLNEDRHTHNIAVIRCVDGTFRQCPIFDNGAALFSDTKEDYLLTSSMEECYQKIEGKPFSQDFDEQMDEAELLYGQQLELTFTIGDILNVLQEAKEYYADAVIDRVEAVLRYQYRKYGYMINKNQKLIE